MMLHDELKEWRDREQERVSAYANPHQRRLQSVILDVLNAVLQED
jgi:hypothetical protein